MEQIDLIKAEIERLKSQLVRGACASQLAMETRCKDEAYSEILDFINSLPEEPVSKNLEEETIEYKGEIYTRVYKDELDKFANIYPKSVPRSSKKYAKYSDVDMTIAVKAGAQWQKEHDLLPKSE